MMLNELKADLKKVSSPSTAKNSQWFFKTGKGQYGEGDVFAGVTVPQQRAIAKKYSDLDLDEIAKLLRSEIHENRLIALFVLVGQYKKGSAGEKIKVVEFYLKHKDRVNNWDLVDSSAPYILGNHLLTRKRSVLDKLAASKSLWDRRIAVVATLALIRNGEFEEIFKLCTHLRNDKQDLLHKACGWMLREVGKQNLGALEGYLERNKTKLPRTALRYAIERMTQEKRYYYMGKIKKA